MALHSRVVEGIATMVTARKATQKIRIRLKAYDHKILDQSASRIEAYTLMATCVLRGM